MLSKKATYYPPASSEEESVANKQKGRLKICSKSLIFEPEDVRPPVARIPFSNVLQLGKFDRGRLLQFFKQKDNVIVVLSSLVVFMKPNNEPVPYRFMEPGQGKSHEQHCFALHYVSPVTALSQLRKLLEISKVLEPGAQDRLYEQILEQKEQTAPFDRGLVVDYMESERLELPCHRITPLVREPGRVLLTNERLYFQPFNNAHADPVTIRNLSHIEFVAKRRQNLLHVGLELFSKNNEPIFFAFRKNSERDQFYDLLQSQPSLDSRAKANDDYSTVTLRWRNGKMSNFDYLMYLNHMADRTPNDLAQYPVFPWVIADYESDHLDLSNPKVFRDLTKPVGALNATRLATLRERFNNMPANDPDHPRFLYGSHYSTPGYVLYYLVRTKPECMLRLQNGKFDAADRLFHSMAETYKGCLNSPTDVKELIPEFYDTDAIVNNDFLMNNLQLDLGIRQDGEKVNNVCLPPWASSSFQFIQTMRNALESDFVSAHLHHWIDLIFGYKQRGVEAEKADNVFYHMTYEGAVDMESITDPLRKRAIQQQITEFGQTPKQLFTAPHPQRTTVSSRPAVAADVEVSEHSLPSSSSVPLGVLVGSQRLTVSLGAGEEIRHENVGASVSKPSAELFQEKQSDISLAKHHREKVTWIDCTPDDVVYSTSTDCLLKLYSLSRQTQLRSFNDWDMALSSGSFVDDSYKLVALGSWDNNVYLYSVDYGRNVDELPAAHDDAVSCLHTEAGQFVCTGSWDTSVKVWALRPESIDRLPVAEFHEIDDEVRSISMNRETTMVFGGTSDGQVYCCDTRSNTVVRTLHPHYDSVNAILVSADGRRLTTVSADGHFKVTEIDGAELCAVVVSTPLLCAASDESTLVVGGENGLIQAYNLAGSAEKLQSISADDRSSVTSICFKQNRICAGFENGRIQIFD